MSLTGIYDARDALESAEVERRAAELTLSRFLLKWHPWAMWELFTLIEVCRDLKQAQAAEVAAKRRWLEMRGDDE